MQGSFMTTQTWIPIFDARQQYDWVDYHDYLCAYF